MYICNREETSSRVILAFMNPLDNLILENILRTDGNNIVLHKEDVKVEYKRIFERNSREAKAKYLKELVALHNNDGGYLIFGVDDKTYELIGLKELSTPDNAHLSDDLKIYFSPTFPFVTRTLIVDNKTIFVIYVEKRTTIPSVCIKEFSGILSEATVYWRYSGESTPIKSGDLITLFHSLRGQETSRLADIQERDTKAKYKPYLKWNGFRSFGSETSIGIMNTGARVTINEIKVIEGDVKIHPYGMFPIILENNQDRRITLLFGSNWQYTKYKIEIHFKDSIGTSYIAIGENFGQSGKINDPVEV